MKKRGNRVAEERRGEEETIRVRNESGGNRDEE
jgi:hypothetical protein